VLNRVYANVAEQAGAGCPRAFPPAWLRASFALLAAGAYKTYVGTQEAVCLPLRTVEPIPRLRAVYESCIGFISRCVFCAGRRDAEPLPWGGYCRELRRIAASVIKAA